MGRAIIQDEFHGVHLPIERFWNARLLDKALEIHKAFAVTVDSVNLSICHRKGGRQTDGEPHDARSAIPATADGPCGEDEATLRLHALGSRFSHPYRPARSPA